MRNSLSTNDPCRLILAIQSLPCKPCDLVGVSLPRDFCLSILLYQIHINEPAQAWVPGMLWTTRRPTFYPPRKDSSLRAKNERLEGLYHRRYIWWAGPWGGFKDTVKDFSGGSVVKNLLANAGDVGSIPDRRRSHMPQSNEALTSQLLSLCSRD